MGHRHRFAEESALLLISVSYCANTEQSLRTWSQSPGMSCQNNEGLNNKTSFLTVLAAGKSKIKEPADWLPGEGSLLACPRPPSLQPLCCLENQLSGVSPYQDANPTRSGPTLMTSPNPITSVKVLSPNSTHWGLGLRHVNGVDICTYTQTHQNIITCCDSFLFTLRIFMTISTTDHELLLLKKKTKVIFLRTGFSN